MKEKILAELNKKYLGLSSKVLGLVADKLAKTVTEESAIEGAIAELEKLPISLKDYADFLQAEGDRRVTDALKKEKEKKEDPKDPPKDPKEPANDPTSELAKQLAEINKKLATLEKEKTQSSLAEKLNKALGDKKIPIQFAKGRVPESEDALESVITEIEADYGAMKQELANQGFAEVPKPGGGNDPKPSDKAVAADIAAWAKNAQPAQQPAAAGK